MVLQLVRVRPDMLDLLLLVDRNASSALSANYNWPASTADVATHVKELAGAVPVAKSLRTHRFAHVTKITQEIPSLIAIQNQVLK